MKGWGSGYIGLCLIMNLIFILIFVYVERINEVINLLIDEL